MIAASVRGMGAAALSADMDRIGDEGSALLDSAIDSMLNRDK